VAAPKTSALYRLRWLLLGPIPVGWCIIAHLGYLAFLENKVVDLRFRFRGPLDAPIKIVYVNVDSISLDEIGGWPWSRSFFAEASKALLEQGQVRAIGMDFVFSDEGVAQAVDQRKLIEGNRALGGFLWRHPEVVVGASYTAVDYIDPTTGKRVSREFPDVNRRDLPAAVDIPPPELPSFNVGKSQPFQPPGVALIDTVDSQTRFVRVYAPSAVTYYAMAVDLARVYYGVPRDGIRITPEFLDLVRPDGSRAARIPLWKKQVVEINWFSPWFDAQRNPNVGFSDLYRYVLLLKSDKPEDQKTAQAFFAQFKDAVVLIGPTDDLSFHDRDPTPMDEEPVPKVSVHGNLLKTIVAGKYIRRLPDWGVYLLINLLSMLVTALAVEGNRRAVFAKVMAVLSGVVYVATAFEVFKTGNLILPVVAPLGAALSTGLVALLWQVVEEQKAKSRIKGMFGAYVAPALVARMVDSGEEPKLGGVEETITAYFSDIQSFSTFSEKLSPPRLVELMNEYLTACTDIIQAEGGTLDKYIGDAVVAIYGAPLALPDHPLRAAVAALRVHRRCHELRAKWEAQGDHWPEIVKKLQTRIGLNSGPCVVGNMGSHTRFNYTMMGDNVNIAARMESGAKSWGVYTMCTESTRDRCEQLEPGRIVFRALGRIIVKGRTTPLPIFELAALREDATDRLRECIRIFEAAMQKYYARDWDGALELFHQSEQLEPNGPGRAVGTSNNPSLVYIAITEGYREEPPPADWDGVFEMKEK